MEGIDLIIGVHSILAALKNPNRVIRELYLTKKAKEDFLNGINLTNIKVNMVDQHRIQEEAKKFYIRMQKEFKRISSEMFLLADSLPIYDVSALYKDVESGKPLKIFCLDQVTDVHNGAAIFRTAAFYGVDYLVMAQKGNFGLSPSFFKMASGGCEYVKLVQCSNLSKTVTNLQKLNVITIGFLESGEDVLPDLKNKSLCLVMGAEDRGISHAVRRVLEFKVSLKPQGKLSTLNVSVASAIVMEKCFPS